MGVAQVGDGIGVEEDAQVGREGGENEDSEAEADGEEVYDERGRGMGVLRGEEEAQGGEDETSQVVQPPLHLQRFCSLGSGLLFLKGLHSFSNITTTSLQGFQNLLYQALWTFNNFL